MSGSMASAAECTLDGPAHDGRPAACRPSHPYRPHQAARKEPRVLQRRTGWRLARRVQRQGGRASRCPADRCAPVKPQPVVVENAEVDTKPQLEIYADDVKCSHGATVGQLDADHIYYLRSRGVDDNSARALLTFAFAKDVVERLSLAPLRSRLEKVLLDQLPEQVKELL